MYVPGLRLSARILVPPWKVAVAPTTAPEADATVRLCDTAAMFVKEIDTDPAVAVSVLWSNFNRPSGFAATLRVAPAVAAGGAAVDELVAGGLDPLTAYLYVIIAVTIASPVLVISLLRGGLRLASVPLLIVAIINTGLLCSFGYAVMRDIRMRMHRILER